MCPTARKIELRPGRLGKRGPEKRYEFIRATPKHRHSTPKAADFSSHPVNREISGPRERGRELGEGLDAERRRLSTDFEYVMRQVAARPAPYLKAPDCERFQITAAALRLGRAGRAQSCARAKDRKKKDLRRMSPPPLPHQPALTRNPVEKEMCKLR